MQRGTRAIGRIIATWAVLVAACLCSSAVRVAAQTGTSGSEQTKSGERTTLSGVYTAAQAARGQDTFAGFCQGCHTPASHATVAFVNAWRDKPLAELFRYLSEAMPKSDPGTLTPQEYAQVLAYLLKLNGMPAGDAELPADPAILQSIRFEPKK